MRRARTDYLVVHCSATPPHMDIGRDEIDSWHRERGFSRIGYHYVIRRTGEIEAGRQGGSPGAHVKGYNAHALGICLVGGTDSDGEPEDNFNFLQMDALWGLLRGLKQAYPEAEILGHRDFPDVHKACPSFSVRTWMAQRTQAEEEK